MRNPHQLGSTVLVSSLVCLFFLLSGQANSARAQAAEPNASTARGIQLYKQGDAPGAVKVLKEIVKKHPDDADAWYYLGLAFNSQGLIAEARPRFERVIELRPDSADAHAKLAYALILANEPQRATALAERAIELGDQSAEAHYALAEANLRNGRVTLKTKSLEMAIEHADMALMINPSFSPALITKSLAHYKLEQYSEAGASLEKFLALDPDDADADTWREQRMLIAVRARDVESAAVHSGETETFSPKAVTQKARVLTKPEPQYTEAARRAAVVGTIIIRCVFAADGEVKNLRVDQALPFGLTTRAIQAARRIKFTPATIDGRPVSMYIQLEYNFNLF